MSEIKTAISIVDGMTPAFKSMNNAMNIVMSSFEKLQRTSGAWTLPLLKLPVKNWGE